MYNTKNYKPNLFCTLVRLFYFWLMKMTIAQYLDGKKLNKRVLQRTIHASLQGDDKAVKAKQKLRDKYGITSVEAVSTRLYLINAKQ